MAYRMIQVLLGVDGERYEARLVDIPSSGMPVDTVFTDDDGIVLDFVLMNLENLKPAGE